MRPPGGDDDASHADAPIREPACAVRDVREDDAPAIHAIYAAEVLGGTSNYEDEPPDLDEMRRRIAAVRGAGYPWRVAERAGAVAGYAYASAFRSRAGYRWTVESTVYVHAEHRRRGVAQALMETLIADCEAQGFRQMIAVIGDAGNAASIALHHALGFGTVGVFRGIGHKHGRWLDNVQMQRALGAGSAQPPASADR